MAHNCKQKENHVDEAIARAQTICDEKNISFTPIRKKVLELLWKEGANTIKAYDLLEILKKEEPSAKPTTIYRALDFLLENKLIHKLESQNSFIVCDHPTRKHNCAFLICKKCTHVNEYCNDGNILDELRKNIDPEHFQIENVTMEIHGVCKECGE